MRAPAYTETLLPELGFLVATQGNPDILNAIADFASYFEREDVVEYGGQVHVARLSAAESAAEGAGDPVVLACDLIGRSAKAFAAKSSAIPGLTAMYFPAAGGVAEVIMVEGRTVVATHAEASHVADLLGRHLVQTPEMTLLVRHCVEHGRLYMAMAMGRGRRAYSADGGDWYTDDESTPHDDILERFVACES